MAFLRVHRLVDRLGELPGVFGIRRAMYARRFRGRIGHAFHGVFGTFAAASAAAPATMPASYDNPDSAGLYVDRLGIDDYDYPALFWLEHALRAGWKNVADLGGSIGIKFYAFAQHLGLPDDARWRVIETPAAVRLGREIAAGKPAASRLEFSSDVRDADGFDVLFASGTLQYLPQGLDEILAGLRDRPRRLVINTTPIHPHRSFFTLNNIGTACCPYRVTARDAFVRGTEAQGYRLVDSWRNIGKRLPLPYEPGYGLEHYSGFCFDRTAGAS